MVRGDWTECGVVWDDVADDNRTGDDEPTISFVDDLEGGAWYDVDVTAAVREALENREPCLGIQSASPLQVLSHLRRGRPQAVAGGAMRRAADAAASVATDAGG